MYPTGREQLENKKELHRRETKEEEGLKERDRERNKAEAMLRARVSELESALRDQRRNYEERVAASNRVELTHLCVEEGKQKLIDEKNRTIKELEAKLYRKFEEHSIINTETLRLIDRINELEKKNREINCYKEKVEAKVQDLRGKMKKLAVASVAVGVVAVAGWWFFS
jgi:hypothetical protein